MKLGRGFILRTVVACLSSDVDRGPVLDGRRKDRMCEENGGIMAAAVFTAAGAAASELVQTTAVGGRLPLSLFAPWEEGASGSLCRARDRRSIGLPFTVLSPVDFFAFSISLSLMKTLEERGFYSKQEGSMIIFPSW